jgi:site-specific recombinase XerD
MTFKHYLLQKGYSNTSIITIEKTVNLFVCWQQQKKQGKDISETRHNDVLDYISHLQTRAISNKSIANYLNHTGKYFDYLIKEERAYTNPFVHVKMQGIKRRILYNILSMEELDKLYKSYTIDAPHKFQAHLKKRNKAMLGLLVYQGLQTEELFKISINDLNLRDGKILIPVGRKSAKRILKLEPTQILELMEYLNTTRKVLLNRSMKPTTGITTLFLRATQAKEMNSNTTGELTRQLKVLNNKVQNLNQIRTSVLVHWMKQYNLRQVQHLAGHKSISTTEHYKVYCTEELSGNIHKFHPLNI